MKVKKLFSAILALAIVGGLYTPAADFLTSAPGIVVSAAETGETADETALIDAMLGIQGGTATWNSTTGNYDVDFAGIITGSYTVDPGPATVTNTVSLPADFLGATHAVSIDLTDSNIDLTKPVSITFENTDGTVGRYAYVLTFAGDDRNFIASDVISFNAGILTFAAGSLTALTAETVSPTVTISGTYINGTTEAAVTTALSGTSVFNVHTGTTLTNDASDLVTGSYAVSFDTTPGRDTFGTAEIAVGAQTPVSADWAIDPVAGTATLTYDSAVWTMNAAPVGGDTNPWSVISFTDVTCTVMNTAIKEAVKAELAKVTNVNTTMSGNVPTAIEFTASDNSSNVSFNIAKLTTDLSVSGTGSYTGTVNVCVFNAVVPLTFELPILDKANQFKGTATFDNKNYYLLGLYKPEESIYSLSVRDRLYDRDYLKELFSEFVFNDNDFLNMDIPNITYNLDGTERFEYSYIHYYGNFSLTLTPVPGIVTTITPSKYDTATQSWSVLPQDHIYTPPLDEGDYAYRIMGIDTRGELFDIIIYCRVVDSRNALSSLSVNDNAIDLTASFINWYNDSYVYGYEYTVDIPKGTTSVPVSFVLPEGASVFDDWSGVFANKTTPNPDYIDNWDMDSYVKTDFPGTIDITGKDVIDIVVDSKNGYRYSLVLNINYVEPTPEIKPEDPAPPADNSTGFTPGAITPAPEPAADTSSADTDSTQPNVDLSVSDTVSEVVSTVTVGNSTADIHADNSVTAGSNKSGTLNSASTSRALEKAAQAASEAGETAVTVILGTDVNTVSAGAINKMLSSVPEGMDVKLTSALTDADGNTLGKVTIPLVDGMKDIYTGISAADSAAAEEITTGTEANVLAALETEQKTSFGTRVTLNLSAESLGIDETATADCPDFNGGKILYVVIKDANGELHHVKALYKNGRIAFRTDIGGTILICSNSAV